MSLALLILYISILPLYESALLVEGVRDVLHILNLHTIFQTIAHHSPLNYYVRDVAYECHPDLHVCITLKCCAPTLCC